MCFFALLLLFVVTTTRSLNECQFCLLAAVHSFVRSLFPALLAENVVISLGSDFQTEKKGWIQNKARAKKKEPSEITRDERKDKNSNSSSSNIRTG